MTSFNFIATAKDLLEVNRPGRPRQANLRRATSAIYYEMFHCLARCCADMLLGGRNADRSEPAWRQVYRALEHRAIRQRCNRHEMMQRFPPEIRLFASKLIEMQLKRHNADYDPAGELLKTTVEADIRSATRAVQRFNSAPAKDRRAFAVYLLLNQRNN